MILFGKKRYKTINLEQLIDLAKQDDFDALEELVKRNQNNVYASFYYLNQNCEEILDLTQEALFKMVKNIKKLSDTKKFKPWLNKIVTRCFYDHIRKKSRKIQTIPIDTPQNNATKENFLISEVPCKECTPEESSINAELNCLIRNSIQKLPDSFRLAIVLREFQGLSYEQIADITQTNVGTVKSRIARARNKLQQELKSYIA